VWTAVRARASASCSCLEPERELAEHVRHPSARIAAADVERPFAEDRGIDQGLVPHGAADRGAIEGDLLDGLDGDQRGLDMGQRLEIVIGEAEQRILEIGEIALHVDREDLPPAIARDLVPKAEAGEDETGILGLVAFPDHIFVRAEFHRAMGEGEQGCPILGLERTPELKLGQHRGETRIFGVGHDTLRRRERCRVSQPPVSHNREPVMAAP
jgi:hypothetical protein